MIREARLIIENAYYHVMTRGNQKQKVFRKNEDYRQYLRLLRKYKKMLQIGIYGYCMMPNHIHLIIRPLKPAFLSDFMKRLNQAYTLYFNEKYSKCGHLWQGRFKSMVIMNDQYALDCIEYIEYNPVRAELVKSPGDYEWSSYRFRVFEENSDILNIFETKGTDMTLAEGTSLKY